MSLSRSGLLGGDHIAESRNLYADAADCFDLGACGQTVVAGREPGGLDDEVEIAESGGKVQHRDRGQGLGAGLERQGFDVVANADTCIQIFKRRNQVREVSACLRGVMSRSLVGSVDPCSSAA